MAGGKTDFARLLRIQRVVRSMRERDLADARNRSAAAERALEDLNRMIADGTPVAQLFPNLLSNYFRKTLAEKAAADQQTRDFSGEVIKEQRKYDAIEDRYKEQRQSERNDEDAAAQSETLDQRIAGRLSASSKLGKLG